MSTSLCKYNFANDIAIVLVAMRQKCEAKKVGMGMRRNGDPELRLLSNAMTHYTSLNQSDPSELCRS